MKKYRDGAVVTYLALNLGTSDSSDAPILCFVLEADYQTPSTQYQEQNSKYSVVQKGRRC